MVYSGNPALIIIVSILAAALLGAGLFLLIRFVFRPNYFKGQIKELRRKYSYLDALLIGQDSQYIHRIEIIARTNLLYVDKHEEFSRRFKSIYENDDKFAESMLKQLDALAANKQFKNIASVISDTKKAITILEDAVNALDTDLYTLIKPEEDSRQNILKLKEEYRRVKQNFYANSNELDLVSTSFSRVFEKLDTTFNEFESHIEAAEYDDAEALLPTIKKVVDALDSALKQLPNLCILVMNILPDKISKLKEEYDKVEASGMPLFNLAFGNNVTLWNNQIEYIKSELISLKTAGVQEEIDRISADIENVRSELYSEEGDKEFFENNYDRVYYGVIDLEKSFLKIVSVLPGIEKIYVLDQNEKEQIEELKKSINELSNGKRILDSFVHASVKQPYSSLRKKLEELEADYNASLAGVNEFRTYLNSLKGICQDAYSMVFLYYYHCKQTESLLREIGIDSLSIQYSGKISKCYDLLNEIDKLVKTQPINVAVVKDRAEELKTLANDLFDDVENKFTECQLAESAMVYANRDRNHQEDVHQKLNVLEIAFFDGDFTRVAHDAKEIYENSHVEAGPNA